MTLSSNSQPDPSSPGVAKGDEVVHWFAFRRRWADQQLRLVGIMTASALFTYLGPMPPSKWLWLGVFQVSVGLGAAILWFVTRRYELRRRPPEWLVMTDTYFRGPRTAMQFVGRVVTYDSIRRIMVNETLDGTKVLRLRHTGGRMVVPAGTLASPAEVDTLARLLAERTSLPIETHRIQFSLRTLFLVTTGLAVVLGMGIWIGLWRRIFNPDAIWMSPAMLGMVSTMLLGEACIRARSAGANVFAVGALAGFVVELLAVGAVRSLDLVSYLPGTTVPEGWLPLALPLHRVLFPGTTNNVALFSAPVAGFLAGCLGVAWRWRRKRTRPAT